MASDEKGHQLVDETLVRESAGFDCYRKNVSSSTFILAGQVQFLLLHEREACLFDDLRRRFEVAVTFDAVPELAMPVTPDSRKLTARPSPTTGR